MVKIIGIDYFRSMAVITLDNAVSFRSAEVKRTILASMREYHMMKNLSSVLYS